MRKSLLSTLYGIHVRGGQIQLSKTLADLGIDDRSPLAPLEKSATVGDLLKARSGVYHPALFETPDSDRTSRSWQLRAGSLLVLQQLGLQRARHNLRAGDQDVDI